MKKISNVLQYSLCAGMMLCFSNSLQPMWFLSSSAPIQEESFDLVSQKLDLMLKNENYPQLFDTLKQLLKNPLHAESAFDWVNNTIEKGYVPLHDFFVDYFIRCSQEAEGLIEMKDVNRVFSVMLRCLLLTDLVSYWTAHKWLDLTEKIQSVRKNLCKKYLSFINKAFVLYKPCYRDFLAKEVEFITSFINKEEVHKSAWFHKNIVTADSVIFEQPTVAQWQFVWGAHDDVFIQKTFVRDFEKKILPQYLKMKSWEELFSVDVA